MNTLGKIGSGGAFAAILISWAAAFAAAPAAADVATRCGAYGCEAIRCNDSGDHCYRINGYAEGYGDGRDGGYYRSGYRDYDDRGYYAGHLVCDSDGDRCYRTHEPYWSYREYYRRHGYRWHHEARYDGGYGYGGYRHYGYDDYREQRFTDRLNRDEAARAREYNDEY
jgi:hypothetical protein